MEEVSDIKLKQLPYKNIPKHVILDIGHNPNAHVHLSFVFSPFNHILFYNNHYFLGKKLLKIKNEISREKNKNSIWNIRKKR